MKGWKLFMKKNVLMRFASGALVITMLTTCVISGTFAKYITDDSAHDKARVAKWGITLAVAGSLYGETYYHGTHADGANEVTVTDTDNDISVYGKQMDTAADDKANRQTDRRPNSGSECRKRCRISPGRPGRSPTPPGASSAR